MFREEVLAHWRQQDYEQARLHLHQLHTARVAREADRRKSVWIDVVTTGLKHGVSLLLGTDETRNVEVQLCCPSQPLTCCA
ncbi:hypothetical protein [Ktedonobacter sp. SOSP1-52]|uniref:hypothetical protein n=1 Tax=Ktedonobacter sp. SOSP1-52 TaxID=2778366 RepID=UPI0019155D5A|nr:hypothetical protein [Ktedonobacter sp. SOSP1-52]